MKPEEIRNLVAYRAQQATESLREAEILMDTHCSPRSVVNRCYYAMFYAALALLQTVGKTPSRHSGAISLFDQEFVLKGIFPSEFSNNFHRLFDLRQSSDYKVAKPTDTASAEEARQKAGHFVEAVRKFLAEQGWL